MTNLVINPCRSLCAWQRTKAELDGLPVLACQGCGSQWIRTEGWTPIDHTGHIPDCIRDELTKRPR